MAARSFTNERFWFLLGCLGGAIAVLLLILLFAATTLSPVLSKIVFDYQTLLAGLLAVIIGVATIAVMVHQIRDIQRGELDRRERRDYATRAVLPHMLASINQYAEDCVSSLLDLYEHNANALDEKWNAPEKLDTKILELPIEVATAIRENIEVTSDLSAREEMRWLLHKMQVQRSRFGGYLSGIKNPKILEATGLTSWKMHVWDALEIYALSSQLLDYARPEKELLLPLDDYMNAARICRRIKPEMSEQVEELVIQKWRITAARLADRS